MTAKRGSCFLLFAATVCLMGATCEDPSLTIAPAAVENGIVGEIYSESLTAADSTSGQWSVSAGELPPGLSLNANTGNISGTPTLADDFEFTIALNRFPFGGSAEKAYQMTVHPKLVVDFSPEVARQGEAYSYTIDTTGGVTPYTYVVVGLPAGLSFDEDTGEISGTPVEPEEGRTLQVFVTDSGDPTQTLEDDAEFRIRPPSVRILTDTLQPGRVALNYDDEVEIESGQSPFTFSVTDGALPPGVNLPDSQSTGRLTGVPTEAGTFTFTITVIDSDDPASSDSKEYTITIAL